MADAGFVTRLQRASSRVPGAAAVKRSLHNHAAACGALYRLLTLRSEPGITIVTYHRLFAEPDPFYGYGIPVSLFEAHLQFFRQCCTVLSLDDAITCVTGDRPLPRRGVVITFDDGYRDVFTRAWPLLKRYRLPATLFVAVDAVERGLIWPDVVRHAVRQTAQTEVRLEHLGSGVGTLPLASEAQRLHAVRQLDARLRAVSNDVKERALDELTMTLLGVPRMSLTLPGLMLSWEEIRRMHAEGLGIGAHSMTHPVLARLSEAEAAHEIARSGAIVSERLGEPVFHFCYPFGGSEAVGPVHYRLAEAAGFRSACTTSPGANRRDVDQFALKRIDGTYPSLRRFVGEMISHAH